MSTSEIEFPAYPPFHVSAPAEQRVPYVFNSPHSGRHYPKSFTDASVLSQHQLRRSEDVLVDQLFSSVVEIGAPLLSAHFPRAWLDVNREPFELDPLLIKERLPAHANTRSMRVAGGLGTIARLVAEGVPIYRTPPTLEDCLTRVDQVYRPYHEALRDLLNHSVTKFGYGVLVDCHSMPSTGAKRNELPRPDIIIGDRYGTSCHGDITQELMARFSDAGYSVTVNKPYAGGFITEHYGKPDSYLHGVQIEINRGLYINELTYVPNENFSQLQNDISQIMAHLVSLPDTALAPVSIAAE